MDEGATERFPTDTLETQTRPDPSPVVQVVLNDISGLAKGDVQITEANIGEVLGQLRKQIERGISLDQEGLKVVDSIGGALPTDLIWAMQTEIVYQNQRIPESKRMFGYLDFRDEKLDKSFDADAYDQVVDLHRELYGDNMGVKLIRYMGELVVVTNQKCDERLRIIQVMDSDFPETARYKDYRRQRIEGKVKTDKVAPDRKESFIPVHHLLIQNTETGKVFDARTLIPSDWTLRFIPQRDPNKRGFAQDFDEKRLSYSTLVTPELIIGLLHEHGHNLFTANDDPELAGRAKELWEKSRFTPGGPKGMEPKEFKETKSLLVKNERGASAHAFQIVRMLKKQGVVLDISIDSLTELVNNALRNYERGYPGGKTQFLRPNLTIK